MTLTVHTRDLAVTITARPDHSALRARMAAAWMKRERAIKPNGPALPAAIRETNLHFAARRCGLVL